MENWPRVTYRRCTSPPWVRESPKQSRMAWGISVREQSQGAALAYVYQLHVQDDGVHGLSHCLQKHLGRREAPPPAGRGRWTHPLFAHRDAVNQLPQLPVGDVLQGEDAADLLRDLRLQIPGRVPRQPVQILPEAGAPAPPGAAAAGAVPPWRADRRRAQIAGTLALQLVQTAPESGGRVLRRPGGAGVQPEAYRLRQRGGGGDLGGQPGPELVQQPILREDGAVAAAAASVLAVDGAVPVDILPPGG